MPNYLLARLLWYLGIEKPVNQETMTSLSQETDTRTLLTYSLRIVIRDSMRKTIVLLLILALIASSIIFLPIKAQSQTIVVPDDYPTISSAIQNATNGDTIYVRSGTYTENELKITKSIFLIGEKPESTKINLNSEKHDEPLYPEFPDLYRAIWYDRAMAVHADNFVLSGLTISTTGGDINITGFYKAGILEDSKKPPMCCMF